jgi:hypothetical protein
MTFTLFDRLACIPEISDSLVNLGIIFDYPRVVLIGNRSSGKSTQLRCLTGEALGVSNVLVYTYLEKPGTVRLLQGKSLSGNTIQVVDVPYDLFLVQQYIEQPNAVIVVVIDPRTSLPIKLLDLVSQADPKCARTVGVVSKIDKCHTGDVANILL